MPQQSSPQPIVAFFDVDNTIIRGASSFHLAVGLYRRGFFQRSDIVRFAVHQIRYLTFGENRQQIDEVRQRALEIMHGRSVAEVVAIAEDIYDEVLSLRIFPGTQRLLDQHLRAGHEVWLVTATPTEIAAQWWVMGCTPSCPRCTRRVKASCNAT